jgi:hypothetical protein
MISFINLRVTDCSNRAEIAAAAVTDGIDAVYTNASGEVIVIFDDPGNGYRVQISRPGYQAITVTLYASQEGTTQTYCLDHLGATERTSCFTGGTRVTLVDGEERSIQDVRTGDFVLGRYGQANQVIGIERPLLGRRSLYALNGGSPFVTAEHPIMTTTGWKSIDPRATAEEDPLLIVGRLAVGDVLMTMQRCVVAAGPNAQCLEPVFEQTTLTRMEARHSGSRRPVYNLLLDGDHTYFANGFLVHNCLPPTIPCFIVTAATGTAQSAEVQALRALRGHVVKRSAVAAALIDTIYAEYWQFSPSIAHELNQDEFARQAVLSTVVRPLVAWYTLAGTLAFEPCDRKAIKKAAQDASKACPVFVGGSTVTAVLKAIRTGEEVGVSLPQVVQSFLPKIREAARLPFASWAIFDPLERVWKCAANHSDIVDEVAQWLANAPLESLPSPSTPRELEVELGALADFFNFRPAARHKLGKRLVAAWPDAADALKRHDFV